jgi:DNA invertase Pin-like site-specific DNA recombinase
MRVALYTRVSTRDQGQETENQLKQLREFCGTQGWTVIHEYEDHEFITKKRGSWTRRGREDRVFA